MPLNLSEHSQQALRAIIEQGLPRCSRPYQKIADQLNVSEAQVIHTLNQWKHSGLIKRLGLVVRHRKLGYTSNAMVVWDVDDEEVNELGNILAKEEVVTLCYQRPRRLPIWPYNLFCMIHGQSREEVLKQLDEIIEKYHLKNINKDVLFSTQAFKQRGGYFTPTLSIDPPVHEVNIPALNTNTMELKYG